MNKAEKLVIGLVVGIIGIIIVLSIVDYATCVKGHYEPCTMFIMAGKVLIPYQTRCYVCDERKF